MHKFKKDITQNKVGKGFQLSTQDKQILSYLYQPICRRLFQFSLSKNTQQFKLSTGNKAGKRYVPAPDVILKPKTW